MNTVTPFRFVVSYPQTNWDYAKFRFNRIIRGKDKSNEVFKGLPGGKIQWFEHRGGLGNIHSLGERDFVKPFGMHYIDYEGLYFIHGLPCSETGVAGDEHIARLNDQGQIDLEIRSPLLTQVRSLRRTADGILVTASGIDALLEFNLQGQLIWSWWATEHGYDQKYGGGTRSIDKTLDHRLYNYPGRLQTTHLNSAIVDPYHPDYVLTILFYQGQVVRIHKPTLSTEIVLSGLNGAHHLRPHSSGYVLSNSRTGEFWILDRQFNVLEKVLATVAYFPVKWVQDCLETPWHSHLIADCNTFRLREYDRQGGCSAIVTKMPNRIFQIEPVSETFKFI